MNREIFLFDLFLYILSKWRGLILGGLVAALVAGSAFCFLQIADNQQGSESAKDTEVQEGFIFDELSEEELLAVETKTYMIKKFEELEAGYKKYAENSGEMFLNPNHYYTLALSYSISSGNSNQENVIAEAYKDSMGSFELLEKIADTLGEDKEPIYYESVLNLEIVNDTEHGDTAFKVVFMDNDEEKCKRVLEVLENEVKKCSASIRADDAHKITKVSEAISVCTDSELLARQNVILNGILSNYNSANNIKKAFNEKEQKYYQSIEKEIKEDSAQIVQTETKEDSAQIMQTETYKSLNVKKLVVFVILGAIVGMFAAAFLHCVIYLLDARIRTKNDLKKCSGGVCLTIVDEETANKTGTLSKIDFLIRNLQIQQDGSVDNLSTLSGMLQSYVMKNQIHKICITGSVIDAMNLEEKWSELLQDLKGIDVEVIIEKEVFSNTELVRSENAVAVLLVEKYDKSRIENVNEIVNKLKHCNMEIFGNVLVY